LLNVTASDSSTSDYALSRSEVQLDVSHVYEITLLRLMWEVVLVLMRATKAEEAALLSLFLTSAHEEMLRFGMVLVNSGRFPSAKSDSILEAVSDMSIGVSRVYKTQLKTPLLTPMIKTFLAELVEKGSRGSDAPPPS